MSILPITGIMATVEIANSSQRSRRKRGHSVTLMMQRSGVRSIAPQDTIWKSAKLS
jgi:hypothetical protein